MKLELEITEELQKSLEGECQKRLLSIEQLAVSILASNQKPQGLLGIPMKKWAQAFGVAVTILVDNETETQGKENPEEEK